MIKGVEKKLKGRLIPLNSAYAPVPSGAINTESQ